MLENKKRKKPEEVEEAMAAGVMWRKINEILAATAFDEFIKDDKNKKVMKGWTYNSDDEQDGMRTRGKVTEKNKKKKTTKETLKKVAGTADKVRKKGGRS